MRRWRILTDSQRKHKIVYALSLTPMTRKRLGEVVGTYRLSEFVADLTAQEIICMNQSTKKIELLIETMVKP